MRVSSFVLIALAACGGDNNHSADAGSSCADAGPACGSACPVTFTGNLDASSSSPANCAQVGPGSGSASADSVLGFQLAGSGLDAPLAVSIDIGPSPSPGTYSSETSANWSALGSRSAAMGECIYSAGALGVPTGSFTMTLAAIDPVGGTAHGELRIVQYVQAQETVDCGSGDNEIVDVQF